MSDVKQFLNELEADVRENYRRIATAIEAATYEAVSSQIGNRWTLEDIKGRGIIEKSIDGTHIFIFGGVPLLKLGPLETRIEGDRVFITQSIKRLWEK